MPRNAKIVESVDEYIASFPTSIQVTLQALREAIRDAAPEAEEEISYQMPAYRQNGILVWFAAFKDHIGFFPKTSVIEEFKEKLAPYKSSKGTIRFPINQPIPLELVKEIVRFRVEENANRTR